MYKYQCSKNDCKNTWILPEGGLNGFTLTCPVCGKGRGVFVAQLKNDVMSQTKETEVEKVQKHRIGV